MSDRPYDYRFRQKAETDRQEMASFTLEPLLHYTFAIVALSYVFIGAIVTALRSGQKPDAPRYRRRIHLAIFILIVTSYISDAFIHVFEYGAFDEGEPQLLQLLVLAFVWSWVTFRPSDPASIPCGTAIISAIFEISLFLLLLQRSSKSTLFITQVVLQSIRFVLFLAIVASSLHNKPATFVNDETHVSQHSVRLPSTWD